MSIADRNTTDNKSGSYRANENYTEDRAGPFGRITASLLPFFASRQVVCGAGRVGLGVDGSRPVSYTHLDVYKRQWGTRFLTNLANALGTGYLLFYLTDAVHHPDPTAAQTMLILVYAGLLVVSTVIAGVWSDRVGRRRVFVIWAGVVLAGASCLLALQQTFTGCLLYTSRCV